VTAAERVLRSLRQEHARLSQLLTLLSRESAELEREPRAVVPLLREALQYVVQHTNVHHHPREEVLFEQLARRSPQHRELRDALEREHEATVRAGLSKLRALEQLDSSQAPSMEELASLALAIDRFARGMRDHIVREEEILYSGAERLLEASDWRNVEPLRETPDPLGAKGGRNPYPKLRAYFSEAERRTHGALPSTFERLHLDEALDRFGDGVAWIRRVSSMGPSDKVWLGMRAMWAISLAASPWPWWRLMATALGPDFAPARRSTKPPRRDGIRRRTAR
jgi:hemerythrin-like domain-containing protein